MKGAQIDVVELGFRFLKNEGFKGPCAFTTDDFIRTLSVPPELTLGVMVNGADLHTELGCISAMERLFLRQQQLRQLLWFGLPATTMSFSRQ